ncbi:MAG: GNAT family N-acetyltransferase, partial [Ferruginibacter sp.]
MILLDTPRLILRQFIAEDAPFLFAMNNEPEVIRYTGDQPFASEAEASLLIKNYDQYKNYRLGRLTVILKDTQKKLGWCGLKFHPENNEVELGYRFKMQYWGNGYATEASRASIEYGFNELKLPFIAAIAKAENTASIHVMKKLGMFYWKDVIEHDGLCVCY